MTIRLPAFNVLVDLARHDHEGLENLRQRLVESVINSASSESSRRKLRGVQFKVDMARRKAPNPLSATIAISEMMCQSLAELHRSLVTPIEDVFPSAAAARKEAATLKNAPTIKEATAKTPKEARIIEFPTA